MDFLRNSQHEDFNRLFPYGRVHYDCNHGDHDLLGDTVIPLAVQVTYFECGGAAVAVSLSHKIADGCSLAHFVKDWATVTQFRLEEPKADELPINPRCIPFQEMNMNFKGFSLDMSNDCVTRSFMFPNSKMNGLKLKVNAMAAESGQPFATPTRVEVLSWLVYKCSEAASIKNNPGFKSIGVGHVSNIRGRMIQRLPENTIGNFHMAMEIIRNNETEITPQWFITEMKKKKMELQGLRNMEAVICHLSSMASKAALEQQQRVIDNAYICTSMCGHPVYKIDFGWGKPVKAMIAGNLRKNSVVLMDSPNGDGIEALVCLEKQDMAVFRNDPELLAFC